MTDVPRLRSALWLPLFDELAGPAVVAGPAAEGEEAGWHRVSVRGQLAEMVAIVTDLRPDPTAPDDVAVALPPGEGPAPDAAAGATWWMPDVMPDVLSVDWVRGALRDGPVEVA